MKKIFISVLLTAELVSMPSCSEFLQPKTEGSYSTDSYFSSDQEAIDAVDACYYNFLEEDFLGRAILWEDGAANDLVWGRTRSWPDLATMSMTTSNDNLNCIWNKIVPTIARSNWVVASLLKKGDDLTDVERRSLGEAYFCRALSHFYLAYRYGTAQLGVPFIKYEDVPGGYNNEIPTQQESVVDNYRMIIEDFTAAAELLPVESQYSDADFGRAHKAACYGFMAKVYTYWAAWDKNQYANVIPCVDKLENEFGRTLTGVEFADNFTSDYSKWRNTEYIWTIPSEGGVGGVYGGVELPGVILDNGLWGWFNTWGQFKPTLEIYNEMHKDDNYLADPSLGNIRLKNSLVEYGDVIKIWGEPDFHFYSNRDIESGFMITKYAEPFTHANGYYISTTQTDPTTGEPKVLEGDEIYTNDRKWVVPAGQDAISLGYVGDNTNWPICRMNFPILRFADCLLLRAEAYIATGKPDKAKDDINKVRVRANIKPLTGNATWTDLYHERRVELAFEETGHMYDCKRWALSGDTEIKALALAELNTHPNVRHYEERGTAGKYVDGVFVVNTNFTEGPYEDYTTPAPEWKPYKIAFPYPAEEIAKANGKLKQNEGYN